MPWFKGKLSGPPDAAAVLGRARILGARIVHATAWPLPDQLPSAVAAWSQADRDGFSAAFEDKAAEVRHSLESSGLWAQTTPEERAFFRARLTERTQKQCIDSSWSVESLACLLWALGSLPVLLAYDTEHDPDAVLPVVPAAGTRVSLRPAADLEGARTVAQAWHWRSVRRRLIESADQIPPLPNDLTLDQVVRLSARAAAEAGDFAEPCDEDWPAFGKAYRDPSPDEYAHAASIALKRHKALNWICGFAPKNQWDQTPTDT